MHDAVRPGRRGQRPHSTTRSAGYSFSWGALPAVQDQGGVPPGPCDNLFESFQLGVGRPVDPGRPTAMLNPQPLPP